MTDQIVKSLTDPSFLIAVLVSIAVFATVSAVMPAPVATRKARMKSVALERDELRQAARLARVDRRRKACANVDRMKKSSSGSTSASAGRRRRSTS